jgi:hypothetical protein
MRILSFPIFPSSHVPSPIRPGINAGKLVRYLDPGISHRGFPPAIKSRLHSYMHVRLSKFVNEAVGMGMLTQKSAADAYSLHKLAFAVSRSGM